MHRPLAFWKVYEKGVIALCIFVILAAAVLGYRTASEAGRIWDDAHEIMMMNALIQIGNEPQLEYQAAKERLWGNLGSYYGVVPQFIAHGLESMWSGRPWTHIEELSLANIEWRHLVCYFLMLFTSAILFVTVTIVSGRWILGLAMAAVFISTPVSLGLLTIDPKDAPVAAGLTFLSCGAALLLWRLFRHKGAAVLKPVLVDVLAAVLIFVGSLFAVGTRSGSVALVAAECAIVLALFTLAWRIDLVHAARSAGILSIAALAGAVIAVFMNPLARKSPASWIIESISYAANTGVAMPVRLYGHTPTVNALPWWYVPGWIIAEYPAAFLALFALGLLGAILLVVREPKLPALYPWVPFVVQGFVLPVFIIVSGAVLYDRLRHVLFIVPPLCMLAGFGVYFWVNEAKSGTFASAVLAIVAPMLLILNFAATWTWYPYQYAYLSEIARSFPQFAFDNEPLGLSVNEGIRRMHQLGMKGLRAGPAPIVGSYDAKKLNMSLGHVSIGYREHPQPVRGGGAYYIHTRPSWRAAGLPDFCRTLFKIERQGVILGVGGEC